MSSEEFLKKLAEIEKDRVTRPPDIVPCKRRSKLYAPFKSQRLEAEYGYPAGRKLAQGIIESGRLLWGVGIGQVHEGRILRRASKTVVIKSVELATEKGVKGLPCLLREARAYEDLKQLGGKCLPRFFGSGMVDNQYALVLEKVPGRMLQSLGSEEKAECKDRVLEAYAALHAAHYVQGDVSGSNVLVDKERVTIIDLGYAEKIAYKTSRKFKEEMKAVLGLFDQLVELKYIINV